MAAAWSATARSSGTSAISSRFDHAGFLMAPFADATISQLPSAPGNQPTGVARSWPLLRPTVVRMSALKPMNLPPPLRRMRRAIALFIQINTCPCGCRAPRVPVFVSKLMRPVSRPGAACTAPGSAPPPGAARRPPDSLSR